MQIFLAASKTCNIQCGLRSDNSAELNVTDASILRSLFMGVVPPDH
jgi:hypothetical protein